MKEQATKDGRPKARRATGLTADELMRIAKAVAVDQLAPNESLELAQYWLDFYSCRRTGDHGATAQDFPTTSRITS